MTVQHVFISYSRRDAAYVEQLVAYLHAHYIPAWADSAINYGEHWEDVIIQQIDTCGAFVPVMTPSSWGSPWVRNEIARARLKEKPILPLLLDGEIFFGLSHVEAEDVRTGEMPRAAFITRLQSLVRGYPAGAATPSATPTQPSPTQPSPTLPARRSRRWLWPSVAGAVALVVVATVVSIVLAAGGGPGGPGVGAGRSAGTSPTGSPIATVPIGAVAERLTSPRSIGPLTLSYVSPAPSGSAAANSFGYDIKDRTGSVYLVYTDPTDATHLVNVMAVTGTVPDYSSALDAYLVGMKTNTIAQVDPGALSGIAKCGTLQSSATYSGCAWADPGSVGLVYCYNFSQSDCASLSRQIRDAVLIRE